MNDQLVITGCGVVSPAGLGIEPLWAAVAAGRALAQPLDDPAFAGLGIRRAGRVSADVELLLTGAGLRVAAMMSLAAEQAVCQAGWQQSVLSASSTGLCAATSKGDLAGLFALREQWLAGSLDGQAADFPLTWPDGPAVRLARRLAIAGPAVCPVAACGTGTHALIRGAQMIADGDVARVLVVAADASVIPLLVAAFQRMGVLSADAICRPFDRHRNGFVLAEGAAAVTVESAGNAVGRPIVQLAGFLTGADPTGLAAQDPTGATLARAIRLLLNRAGMKPRDIYLYSAHGTATPSNDAAEAAAIRTAFGSPGHADRLRVIASKSVVGHLLGAAGLTEAVIAIEAIRRSVQPPVANLDQLDPNCPVRVVRQVGGCPADLPAAVCASLGFGGQFGLVAFRRLG